MIHIGLIQFIDMCRLIRPQIWFGAVFSCHALHGPDGWHGGGKERKEKEKKKKKKKRSRPNCGSWRCWRSCVHVYVSIYETKVQYLNWRGLSPTRKDYFILFLFVTELILIYFIFTSGLTVKNLNILKASLSFSYLCEYYSVTTASVCVGISGGWHRRAQYGSSNLIGGENFQSLLQYMTYLLSSSTAVTLHSALWLSNSCWKNSRANHNWWFSTSCSTRLGCGVLECV